MSGSDSPDPAHWIAHAREDLAMARRLAADAETQPRYVCWLSQQAAEKVLKAALLFLDLPYPKRHDLEELLALLPEGWNVKEHRLALSEVTQWAMESRYPGAWPEPTAAQATIAVATVAAAVEAIVADLRAHGFFFETPDA